MCSSVPSALPYRTHTVLTCRSSRPIVCVAFAPGGQSLAAATCDGSVTLWPVDALSPQLDLHRSSTDKADTEHSYPLSDTPSLPPVINASSPTHLTSTRDNHGLNAIAFSHDNTLLCTGGDDKTLIIWDLSVGIEKRDLRGHAHHVFCCAFSPQTNLLVSGSYDETVRLWDLRQAKAARVFQAHSDPVSAVDVNRDSALIVSGGYDGLCRVWDLLSGQCLKTIFAEKTPPVAHVKFTPNGKFLVASYLRDSTIRLWDFQSQGGCLKSYTGHQSRTYCSFADFLVTHPRKYIVSGSEDGCIYGYDIQTRETVVKLAAPGMDTAEHNLGTDSSSKTSITQGQINNERGLSKHGCVTVACHPRAHIIAASSPLNDRLNTVNIWIDCDTSPS